MDQHTDDTGQPFTDAARQAVWTQTRGQPWLVNALCAGACFDDRAGRDRSRAIDADAIHAAREELILSRRTHLDQLAHKLEEERVRRVVEPILAGGDAAYQLRDLEYLRDLGLIDDGQPPRIANPIYQEVVPRELGYVLQESLDVQPTWYLHGDGRLDMHKLLKAFATFFAEHAEHWLGQFEDYREAAPQLILQAYLQRIVNGGGRMEREYGLGRGRTDLLVLWPREPGQPSDLWERFVIECKVLRDTDRQSLEGTIERGVEQTLGYMERCRAEEGHLVLIDRRAERPESQGPNRAQSTPRRWATSDRLDALVPKGKLHEHTFNVVFGDALRECNARWRENEHLVAVERRATIQGSAERPDIRIDDRRAPRVAIECAFGGDNDRDALARLGPDGEFDTAIAVNIPRSFEAMTEQEATKALKGGATVGYAVLQHGFRFPTSGFIEGTPQDLAAIIPFASVTKERVEAVADEVAKRIDSAADALADGMASNDWEQIAQTVYQRSVLTGFRTVMILWFDAMLVQSHLRASGQPFDELPLPQELIPSELAATWQRIMETNWRSIFAPAVEVLENSTRKTRGATSDALRILLEAVEVLESSQLRDHFNVGAELFPKISEDRKTAAAFYTTAATAELLAALTIRPDDRHEWADETLFQRLRIADLACGTGALLRLPTAGCAACTRRAAVAPNRPRCCIRTPWNGASRGPM